jgi:hypothetical protein
MKTIIIKNQAELDVLPDAFEEFTTIEIRTENRVAVRKHRENSRIRVLGRGWVGARGDSRVEARENSQVVAWGNSRVEACGNSWVKARENSRVVAWENSWVEARENSRVEAWGDSRVEARENSRVKARENSRVVVWGDSRVEANENSLVDIWDQAEATGLGKINVFKSNISKDGSVENWIASEFVKVKKGFVTLYKRVSKEFKTQEGTKNETLWSPGTKVEHANWNPGEEECGAGKFHACSRPYFCDEFRSELDDKYIAIKVGVKDLVAWKNPDYPHKIAFRRGEVIGECGRVE